MKIAAIIAEYNPFHNGHAYHIEETKRLTGADKIVVVMSGDFVQRGAPAAVDKFARTKMALSSGADMVVELPVFYSTASADLFARGAISLVDTMGCCNVLSFGCENACEELKEVARLLAHPPEEFQMILQSYVKADYPYALAREMAVRSYTKDDALASLLSKPNNILAISYMTEILHQNSPIEVCAIERLVSDYHSKTLHPLGSASAVRHCLESGHDVSSLARSIPPDAYQILKDYIKTYGYLHEDDFTASLLPRMIYADDFTLSHILESSHELITRMRKYKDGAHSFSELCQLIKHKNVTYTRVSRFLTHILLGITTQDLKLLASTGPAEYIRILGCRKDSSELLSLLSKTAKEPVLTQCAKAKYTLPPFAYQHFEKNRMATDLYRSIRSYKSGVPAINEYKEPMVML
jgi:predicted nucleotidyltransferase